MNEKRELTTKYVLPLDDTETDGLITYMFKTTFHHRVTWLPALRTPIQAAKDESIFVTKQDIDNGPDWVRAVRAVQVTE